MTETAAESRLIDAAHSNPNYHTDGGESGNFSPIAKPHHEEHHGVHVDVNVMKRNMSIAKGFMDIGLMTANASQLRNLLKYGDRDNSVYYVLLTALIFSLILQVATGILLIVKERFDLNLEEDHESAELYNNITILLVFLTLLINVFVSSFGIDVLIEKHPVYNPYDQSVFVPENIGRSLQPKVGLTSTTTFPDVEMINNTIRMRTSTP